MNNHLRIQEALENASANIELLATYSDMALSEKLESIHLQTELAAQKNLSAGQAGNTGSLELLEIWRGQIIAARIYKSENNIPDSPREIEMAIADIETTTVRTEERMEVMEEFTQPVRKIKVKEEKKEDENQMKMF